MHKLSVGPKIHKKIYCSKTLCNVLDFCDRTTMDMKDNGSNNPKNNAFLMSIIADRALVPVTP